MPIGLIVAAAIGLPQVSPNIEKHRDLQVVATFDQPLVMIDEFLAEAQKKTKVKLEVAKELLKYKVDVFVDDQPLGLTLDRVADVLRCYWEPTKTGYRLEMSNLEKAMEAETFKAENTAPTSTFMLQVERARKYATMTHEQRKKYFSNLLNIRAQEAAKSNFQSKKYFELNDEVAVLEAVLQDPKSYLALAALNQTQLESFYNGEEMVVADHPKAMIRFNSEKGGPGTSGIGTQGETPIMMLKYRIKTDSILARAQSVRFKDFDRPELGYTTYSSFSVARMSSTANSQADRGDLEKMRLLKFTREWDTTASLEKKHLEPIPFRNPRMKLAVAAENARLGDYLRWFHQETGLPIVAQADRLARNSWTWSNDENHKVQNGYLKTLIKSARCFMREDKGFLSFKPGCFWRAGTNEGNEKWIRSFEEMAIKGKLSIAELVRFETGITPAQLDIMATSQMVTTLDWSTLGKFTLLYQMLGQLPAYKDGDTIPFTNLNASAQSLFLQICRDLESDSPNMEYIIAKAFGRLNNLAPNELFLKISQTRYHPTTYALRKTFDPQIGANNAAMNGGNSYESSYDKLPVTTNYIFIARGATMSLTPFQREIIIQP